MAKTTVYTCDVCKQSKSEEDLSKITVGAAGIRIKTTGRNYNNLQIDICKDCLKKKGFVVEPKPEDNLESIEKSNQKTLEDKLYEILEDMGVVFAE